MMKPYHGIQWLENTGRLPFVAHTLADLPGVSRAEAADLDGDGNLDIMASAFIALGSDVDEASLPSLVWLEQKRKGSVRDSTRSRPASRATQRSTWPDFNRDGDLDIAVGNFNVGRRVPG